MPSLVSISQQIQKLGEWTESPHVHQKVFGPCGIGLRAGKATLPATSFGRNINHAVSASKGISSSNLKNLQITAWNINKLRQHFGNPDFKNILTVPIS